MEHSIIWILLANTAVATAIALAAWLAGRLKRPAIAHVLWLLVILKLLSPPLWRVQVWKDAVAEPAVTGLEADHADLTASPGARLIPSPRLWWGEGGGEGRGAFNSPAPFNSARRLPLSPTLSPEYRGEGAMTLARVLFVIWAGGAMAYVAIALLRLVRFRRLLRACVAADAALLGEIDALASKIGLPRRPAVRVIEAVCSPMIFFLGTGRPLLLLPASLMRQLDAQQRAAVIAHELAHLKRRDHWVRLFEFAATALLWWHPLLWLARLGLRDAEEQCCDAWVVSLLPQARRRYADALVDAAQFLSRAPALPGASGLGRLGHLRRRLTMIVTTASMPSKSLSRAGRALVAACLIVLPLAPARGQAPAPRAATRPASATTAGDDAARRAVEALLAAARDPDPHVQQAAMQAVSRFGPAAIPTLVDSLDMSQGGELAANLLASLGEQAVDPLVVVLDAKDPHKRLRALQALDGMFPGRRQVPGFGGFDPAMAEGEMMGMGIPGGAFQPSPSPAVKKLAARLTGPVARCVTDEDTNVRLQAVTMLGRLSALHPEESAAKAAVAALNDQSVEVRRAAAATMQNLSGVARDEAVKALTAAVKDADEQVRVAALEALGRLGPAARGATEAIIAALKDPQPRVRIAAATALGAMQPQPEPPPADPAAAPMGGGFGGAL